MPRESCQFLMRTRSREELSPRIATETRPAVGHGRAERVAERYTGTRAVAQSKDCTKESGAQITIAAGWVRAITDCHHAGDGLGGIGIEMAEDTAVSKVLAAVVDSSAGAKSWRMGRVSRRCAASAAASAGMPREKWT